MFEVFASEGLMDLLFLVAVALLTVATAGLVSACERLAMSK